MQAHMTSATYAIVARAAWSLHGEVKIKSQDRLAMFSSCCASALHIGAAFQRGEANIVGAGNETTTRLIGWAGKCLAENPDQRRELVEDPSLIPNAIEETLRFEPTGHAIARYVARDVELHGQTVPEGSALTYSSAKVPSILDTLTRAQSSSAS